MDLIPLFAFAIVVVFPCIIMVFEFRENNPHPLYTAVFYFIFGLLLVGIAEIVDYASEQSGTLLQSVLLGNDCYRVRRFCCAHLEKS